MLQARAAARMMRVRRAAEVWPLMTAEKLAATTVVARTTVVSETNQYYRYENKPFVFASFISTNAVIQNKPKNGLFSHFFLYCK